MAGIRRLSLGLYAVAALLSLATLAVFFVHGLRQSDGLALEVARARNARFDARSMTTRLQEAVAAQRDFLLTGRAEALRSYETERAAAELGLALIGRATADEPTQHARVDRLSHTFETEVAELEGGVAARRDRGLAAAVGSVAGAGDAATMAVIQGTAAEIEAAEIRRLDAMQTSRTSLQRSMNVAGGLTALTLLVMVTVVLWRERRETARHRAHDLKMAGERLQMENLRAEFVSTVSHELRTPLTSIAGALGLLKAGAGGVLPGAAARLVHIAESNSARLMRLIDDVLDIEKAQSGAVRLNLRVQSLNTLAERAVEMMAGMAEHRSVALRVFGAPNDPQIDADADRILQVMTNLISNGVKFSTPGGGVEVRIHGDAQGARAAVVDHGAGVPDGFEPRLFEKFAQSDGSDARRQGGTGLGLAIARDIARRHRGDLTYAPTPGGGATFTLILPTHDDG